MLHEARKKRDSVVVSITVENDNRNGNKKIKDDVCYV
jgi:hypothetical protein